ncbi:MAG: amidase [Xanthobacteraceae bacterium]
MEQSAGDAQVSTRDFGAFVPHGICRHEATGRGVLDGRTFAVKDLIDVAGTRTGAGNPDWLARQAPAARSAPVVEKALAAGASLVGKTVTDELGFSLEGRNVHYPGLMNPICPDRLPGGSSGGSAVAVAAGQVDFALGTDTGGSVRVPANFLGVFGFRPSHGALPLEGVVPFAPSYDTVGWFARDAELLADVGVALLPRRTTAPITKLLLAGDALAIADRPLAQELETRITRWSVGGSTTVFGGEEASCFECYRILQGAEIWQSLGAWIAGRRPRFAGDIAERFAGAALITPAEVANFRPIRDAMRRRFEMLVPPNTALVMPTAPCVAPVRHAPAAVIGDFYQRALTLTSIAGHAGAPEVAFPLGLWRGCPVGVSILAARGSDGSLLDLTTKLVTSAAGTASK